MGPHFIDGPPLPPITPHGKLAFFRSVTQRVNLRLNVNQLLEETLSNSQMPNSSGTGLFN